jgi:hypothetical protein
MVRACGTSGGEEKCVSFGWCIALRNAPIKIIKYAVNHNTCISVIYYNFILHVSASFGYYQVYLNTKNTKRKDNYKHKIERLE